MFTYGEGLVDRIDFEELTLKGVDPSLGPKISRPRSPSEPEDQKKTVLVFFTANIGPSQLNTPLESDPACPSYNCWHVALGSLRGDPYTTRATTSQGVLHVDAIGTVDCTIYVNPYVSISIRPASVNVLCPQL